MAVLASTVLLCTPTRIVTDGEAAKPKPSKLKRCWLLVPGTKLLFAPDKLDTTSKMKRPAAKS